MRNFKKTVCMVLAVLAMFPLSDWIMDMALAERGYHAVGGEVFLLPLVFMAVYKVIDYLFNAEDFEDGNSEAEDGREPGMRFQ